MNKKRAALLSLFVLLLLPGTIFAVPRVAVLDALIPEDMDSAVVVPITDKIMEELVNSGKFIVLDRSFVTQVLSEKEFQISSGLVKTDEIKKVGQYLGADFVVVARASKIGEIYFLSARMIDVKSGAVVSQTSMEKPGKIDVLLEIARAVGVKIAGGEYKEIEEEAPVAAAAKPAAPQPAPVKPIAPTAPTQPRKAPGFVMALKSGINLANVLVPDANIDSVMAVRFNGGFYISFPLGSYQAIQLELLYSRKGYDRKNLWDGFEYFDTIFILDYMEIPFLFKFIIPGDPLSFYISAGGYFGVYSGGTVKFNYEISGLIEVDIDTYLKIHELDYGGIIGLGLDFIFGDFLLNIDVRYSLGFSPIFTDLLITYLNSGFSITAGVGILL